MRKSLLRHDPRLESVSLETLIGVATAIEHEAIRRYEQLERTMRRRGEIDTADAFRKMIEQEREHAATVARWAAQLEVAVADADEFLWALPSELAASWDEIAGSALLTPYRAFAIAVENEQRAFSFYAYLVAHAAERSVAVEAERLAAEELEHAAQFRRWRRAAYHRERRRLAAAAAPAVPAAPPARAASADDLRRFVEQRLAAIASEYRSLADRLRAAGDAESAQLLDAFRAANRGVGSADAERQPGAGDEIPAASDDPVHLLVAAQKPLEALAEELERMLPVTQDDAIVVVERASTDAAGWIARLSAQVERRSTSHA
ncbi:MAG: hypothetical protein LT106_17400 [Burkholderiaceae bacterium]|nr:hypothetical protein [Burkholderiaceae bacterium]